MSKLQAVVSKGRIVLDIATDLPEGMVLDLVVDDAGDTLTDEERRALHESLRQSREDIKAGRFRDARAVLDELPKS